MKKLTEKQFIKHYNEWSGNSYSSIKEMNDVNDVGDWEPIPSDFMSFANFVLKKQSKMYSFEEMREYSLKTVAEFSANREMLTGKMYSRDEVEKLLGKILADSNSPKYTIQKCGDRFTMEQIFPLNKWIKDNMENIGKNI